MSQHANAKHDDVRVYGEMGFNLTAHWAAPWKHEVIITVFGDMEVIDDLDKNNATLSDKVRNPTARNIVISLKNSGHWSQNLLINPMTLKFCYGYYSQFCVSLTIECIHNFI